MFSLGKKVQTAFQNEGIAVSITRAARKRPIWAALEPELQVPMDIWQPSGSTNAMSATASVDAVRCEALWFESTPDGLRPLVDVIDAASLVLIGEATHGTDEF